MYWPNTAETVNLPSGSRYWHQNTKHADHVEYTSVVLTCFYSRTDDAVWTCFLCCMHMTSSLGPRVRSQLTNEGRPCARVHNHSKDRTRVEQAVVQQGVQLLPRAAHPDARLDCRSLPTKGHNLHNVMTCGWGISCQFTEATGDLPSK